MDLSRREFVAGVGAFALGGRLPADDAKLPTRKLGKTGWTASLYALGTAEIPANAEATRAITKLLDAGVNYIDTAPSYTGTRSERVLGEIVPKRRKELFVATKTLARDADGAYAEVHESLERLKIQQIDLLQLHAINDFGTLDAVLSGAVKGLERAKKDGKIRFIGITGHTRPEVIVKALEKYPFDSILIPLSALDAHLSDFNKEVVPMATKLGISIVGMKSLKGMEFAKGDKIDPEPLIRYTMSLPVSTLTIGLRRESEVEQNLRIARAFKPMSTTEMRELEASVKDFSTTGNLWWKRQ
jgi:aryl-alcohol dehydrogenase-like predicted oxidoreductase